MRKNQPNIFINKKSKYRQLQNEKMKHSQQTYKFLKNAKIFIKSFTTNKNAVLKQKELLKNTPKLVQNNQNEKLIKPINKNELKEAIHQMENDKFPGIDGIPIL